MVIQEPPRHIARALAAIAKADATLALPRPTGEIWEGREKEPEPQVKSPRRAPRMGDIPLADFVKSTAKVVRELVDARCDELARENSRMALRIAQLEARLADRNSQ